VTFAYAAYIDWISFCDIRHNQLRQTY